MTARRRCPRPASPRASPHQTGKVKAFLRRPGASRRQTFSDRHVRGSTRPPTRPNAGFALTQAATVWSPQLLSSPCK
eukprot:5015675-Pyramimonas_sp.AAC.1